MFAHVSLLAVGQLLTSAPYPVDFQFMPPSAQPTVQAPLKADTAGPEEAPITPRYNIAHGFGNAVPLSFAVRQIVPPMFRVLYRGTVDLELPVNWSGGRPWNLVLASALQQHGLHLILIGGAATIGY